MQNYHIDSKRLVDLFMNLVQIDSESGDEQNLSLFIKKLMNNLNIKSWIDRYHNVYVWLDGEGEPLMLNTHLDTVAPGKGVRPYISNGYIYSNGQTVLGADSKASIAAMLEMAQIFKKGLMKHRPVLITLTCNEEAGFPTAKYIKSDIKECIVADRGTPLGEVIIEAPFAQVFQVEVQGKNAYATTNFNKGRHAILAASEIISNLPIGNFDDASTSNVGVIKGGTMTTVVPNECIFKGNCYSFSKSSIGYFLSELNNSVKTADKKYGTKTKIRLLESFPGFRLEKKDSLVKLAIQGIKRTEIKPKFKVYKAVTNANILNFINIKSLLISTGVENQHTVQEKIAISTLVNLTKILINICRS